MALLTGLVSLPRGLDRTPLAPIASAGRRRKAGGRYSKGSENPAPLKKQKVVARDLAASLAQFMQRPIRRRLRGKQPGQLPMQMVKAASRASIPEDTKSLPTLLFPRKRLVNKQTVQDPNVTVHVRSHLGARHLFDVGQALVGEPGLR